MKTETIRSDVTVVGGGLAGVCAAIAAARLGSQVVLVNNRPVLGGNSSSEVRVWVCGATAHGINRYARETGIMGELFVENQYRNPEGNPYLWDLVILEAVRAEPNITLLLNTDVHEVEADGPEENRTIRSVTGWMMGSERRIRMESPVFLDCTGDGLVGFMAGARYRIGREAYREYGEAWAPEEADGITLGSTLLFYTKDAGHPVRFVPPSFAKDITQTPIPIKRVIRSGDSGCHYWWIEWGGELDTVHDNEVIRDELWSVIYGIWDYIKNSGRFDAETMTLEWVGSIPGKREYRRFVGDYVLNQNDIIAQEPFPDRIAFGGWSIDLHPPQGMYAEASGSKHMHADGIYHIPYRSLYSANVSNLLFAGRNISASHVAFGTTRVMATCAVMGEAAGTAAA
ncbi:FAD-dependent oxidoreductase, partial [Paenibacillus sp. AR247]|uniref:FAD-dependent oxidoreductase n=1 Tax=Paenibacillus sp. AR247 TaxID=1631599 RepID=UPI000D49816D